jgi:hypothetical protein
MTIPQLLRRFSLAPLTGLAYLVLSLGLPRRLADLPYDKALNLWIPTYDGSGQAVHPDILREIPGSDGIAGPFVLAMTPYPYSIDAFENPSILVSKDGLRFYEEKRGMNPVAKKPSRDHNDDPDISFVDGRYLLFYLETVRPDRQNLVLLESADRRAWTRRAAFPYELSGAKPEPFIVSPALAERNGVFRLFYVNTSARPFRVEYLESRSVDSWDKGKAKIATIGGMTAVPWHLDVVRGGEWYYLLLTTLYEDDQGRKRYDLGVARSRDLDSWTLSPLPAIVGRPWGCVDVYRSSALVEGGDLFIYFSYETAIHEWRIALERRRIADLFRESGND